MEKFKKQRETLYTIFWILFKDMMLKSSNDDFMRMLPHQFSQKNWQNPERICNGVMGEQPDTVYHNSLIRKVIKGLMDLYQKVIVVGRQC